MNPRAAAGPGFGEFVVLVALIISMVALSIDAMLPALSTIAADLGAAGDNDGQQVIIVFFAGMAVGFLLFGPLSDAIGRRPAILAGFAVFLAGCLLSVLAEDFGQMLLGRLLQGLGAAGPRTVSIALVRDRFQGREMARVMSFAMSVFILVPIFAPALGQLVLSFADWRYIFVLFLVLTLVVGSWFYLRQPETLPVERRIPFTVYGLQCGIREVLRLRAALGHTLVMGFVFGAFVGYLASSQQIFQLQYGLGELFPLYFGALAVSIGCASLLNARLVMRFGMRRLSRIALDAFVVLSLPYLAFAWWFAGHPPLWTLMGYLGVLFFFVGGLFSNLNALAMDPLGHVAGVGAAVVGVLSTLMSVAFSFLLAVAYDGSVLPLVLGFLLLGLAGRLTLRWTEAGLPPESARPEPGRQLGG